MNFGGRWVPMHVMDTIFLLWVIAVLIIAAVLFWLMRSGRPPESSRNAADNAARKKPRVRKKR